MKRVLSVLLCCGMLLSLAACHKDTEPEPQSQITKHTHTLGKWFIEKRMTCENEGLEKTYCIECGEAITRPLAKESHDLNNFNTCRSCGYVEFDQNASFLELGIPTAPWYNAGAIANCAWDLKAWDGKIYRAAGDYDKNSGKTGIWSYNLSTQCWKYEFEASDDAIHRFVELDGKLCTTGVDPTSGWDLGNYYIYDNKRWTLVRNLPNGVHNFDMIEFDGKIFAGLGVNAPNFPAVMSTDKGKTFSFIPFYKDDKPVDSTGLTYIRVYEFIVLNDQLYAYASIGDYSGIYRYETDKMVWVGPSTGYVRNSRTNYNYINAKFTFNNVLFLVSDQLLAVKTFENTPIARRMILPHEEAVNDALPCGDLMYVLAYKKNDDGTYKTVIYSSKTGLTNSFTEVLQFDYDVPPTCFILEGDHFYIAMGSKHIIHEKNGMLLRVKLPA